VLPPTGAGAPSLNFNAGEVIFREGDPAKELSFVISQQRRVLLLLQRTTPWLTDETANRATIPR
jgi:hypothetical protein